MDDIINLGVGPYGSAYNAIPPLYENDDTNLFPPYMTLDISEFYSYYSTDPDVNFYLSIGSSIIPGTISSFKITKLDSFGSIVEITNESLDVPRVNPGFVTNNFSNIHILSTPTIITPNGGEIIYAYYVLMWNSAVDSWDHDITYEVQYSVNGSTWIPIATGLTINSLWWNVSDIGYSEETLIKVIASCSGGLFAEDQSDAYFTIFPYPQKIPGYDLFLIVGFFCIIVIIQIKKQLNHNRKS